VILKPRKYLSANITAYTVYTFILISYTCRY